MKREELTKTFLMTSNWKNPLVSMVYTKMCRRCKVYVLRSRSWRMPWVGVELTKTFMMTSNWKNPLVSMVFAKMCRRCKVKCWDPGRGGCRGLASGVCCLKVLFMCLVDIPTNTRCNPRSLRVCKHITMCLTLETLKYFNKNEETQFFFQFEIIINCLS